MGRFGEILDWRVGGGGSGENEDFGNCGDFGLGGGGGRMVSSGQSEEEERERVKDTINAEERDAGMHGFLKRAGGVYTA